MAVKIELTEELLSLAQKLTSLQYKYVIALTTTDMSQREAYIDAGGKAKTENAQDAAASRMLSDVKVRPFYNAILKQAAENAVMTKTEALERLSLVAGVTITDIAEFKECVVGQDENGKDIVETIWRIKNSNELTAAGAASIKSITATKNGPKLEMHDSLAATKQMAELLGWKAATKVDIGNQDGKPLAVDTTIKAPEIAKAMESILEQL